MGQAGLKRPADSADKPRPKAPRPDRDRGRDDFSSIIKTKMQSFTRTGAACDRCRVRKIRCDALPEGCSHCNDQGLACYVTDRVTKRTERRGYLQQLEGEKAAMLARIRELEQLLETKGVDLRPWESASPSDQAANYAPAPADSPVAQAAVRPDQQQQQGPQHHQHHQHHQQQQQQHPHPHHHHQHLHPQIETESASTHQWPAWNGSPALSSQPPSASCESRPRVSRASSPLMGRWDHSPLMRLWDSAPLSSVKGAALSVLGHEIGQLDFESPDTDEPAHGTPSTTPLYNKSVVACLQSIFNIHPPPSSVELPSRSDAFSYAEWYFIMIYPFLPILHKPTFLQLLARMYDDSSFEASPEQLVIVHMVYAQIYYQFSARNRDDDPGSHVRLNNLSNNHYHLALSKYFHLTTSRSLISVQAMAMLVCHTRSFPKPGCSAMLGTLALNKCIELNLHRQAKPPRGCRGGTTLETEMRRRVWWTVLGLLAGINGRLGKPMPIALSEIDVDMPLAVPDEYLTDDGVTDPSQIGDCPYLTSAHTMKVVPIYLDLYATVCSVRRDPARYVSAVRSLEERIDTWQRQIPLPVSIQHCKNESLVFALYTEHVGLEAKFCLFHPSTCLTNDPGFCAETTRICEDVSARLLKVATRILNLKSLDTAWHSTSLYVAAIFSSLVAHWERRFKTTAAEVERLKEDMRLWLSVLVESTRTMGTGSNLPDKIRDIIGRTIRWIELDMGGKHDASSLHPAKDAYSQGQQQQQHGGGAPASSGGYLAAPAPDSRSLPYSSQTTSSSNTLAGTPSGQSPHMPTSMGAPASYSGSNGNGNGNGNGPFDMYAPATTATATGPSAPTPSNLPSDAPVVFATQATQQLPSLQEPTRQAGASEGGWRLAAGQVNGSGTSRDGGSEGLMASRGGHEEAQGSGGPQTPTSNFPHVAWYDWMSAMAADTQDRYSATSALLTLGGNTAGGGSGASLGEPMLEAAIGMETMAFGQWPALIFNGSGATSGA